MRSPDQECWTVAQWLVPVNIRLPRHEPSSVVISAYRRQHTRHETFTQSEQNTEKTIKSVMSLDTLVHSVSGVGGWSMRF